MQYHLKNQFFDSEDRVSNRTLHLWPVDLSRNVFERDGYIRFLERDDMCLFHVFPRDLDETHLLVFFEFLAVGFETRFERVAGFEGAC